MCDDMSNEQNKNVVDAKNYVELLKTHEKFKNMSIVDREKQLNAHRVRVTNTMIYHDKRVVDKRNEIHDEIAKRVTTNDVAKSLYIALNKTKTNDTIKMDFDELLK